MKLLRPLPILIGLTLAGSAFLVTAAAVPAIAQGACPPAQPCQNGPRVLFPVISPVQGLNALTQRLKQQRDQPQQPTQPVPWNYVPVATPPQGLPPELKR
jgi:hypothetical protein